MPVVELDLLIAFVNSLDRHHKAAARIFKNIMESELKGVAVASSAYLEYELVHRSLSYSADDASEEIGAFKRFPNLGERPLTSEILLEAMDLRKSIEGLTYFDSLHASTALHFDGKIVSTDRIYDKVKDLTRINPSNL